jgi:hypothetical protein
MTMDPTRQTYGDLAAAYQHFNTALFGGKLPECLITMQRRQGAYGYFAADRFADPGAPSKALDELALNPAHFAGRRKAAICATLAQEMTHLWQHHFGKPSRPGYHNRELAAKLRAIGLIPTDTGQPGGKETGQRITCYVDPGGAFEHACREFLASGDVVVYQDREKEGTEARLKKAACKTKYTCPNCRINAWAKPGVSLCCGACDRKLQAVPRKKTPVAL